MITDQNHPERQPNEVLIGFLGQSLFSLSLWESKRMGTTPKKGLGPSSPTEFPVFVQENEVTKKLPAILKYK